MLNESLKYLALGWSIIPIRKGSKLPAISSWIEYQKRLPTAEEVKQWWEENPEANIALICGKISGIIVVDIDTPHGGDTKSLALSPTLVSKTGGGGFHYLYKYRQGLIGAKVGFKQGVDIRSEASYIVLPPSVHASGNCYEWMNEGEAIADAPEWLEDKNQQKEKTDWEKFFAEGKAKGLRNMSAAKLAGKILYETSPEMWDTLGISYFRQWNKDFNNPALPEDELLTTWNSIKNKHIKNSKPPEEIKNDGDDEEKSITAEFVKNKTKGTYYLAKYITQKYSIITVGEKEHEMYVYRDGMYFRAENEIIFPEIQRILGEHVTANAKNETFGKIVGMTSYPRSVFLATDPDFIPLANGVLCLSTKVLHPHDPKYRFTYKLPVNYNPTATCPKTDVFLDQILTKEQKLTIQEWMGYYFYRNYMFKKAIIFVGEGDTGKTTLLEVIINLLGKENIASVSLHKMTSDRFAAAHLYEKHGNLVDELSAKDISDTGNFKVATGGGSISGEYKFGNQFSFNNFSKFTFACNKIPDVTDFDDEAYFGRWMVIRFENVITKKIPNFISTLTSDEERSGLFNWVIEGLERLLKEKTFSYKKTAMETKKEMMRSGSSIAVFAATCLAEEQGNEMSKESLYDAYTEFCTDNGLAAETIKMLGTKLPFYVSYLTDGFIQDVGKRVRGWRNVKVVRGDSLKADKEWDEMP